MRSHGGLAVGLLYGAGLVAAQGYADNQVPTRKDEPHIAANFPEVDIEIFSPAFTRPETVPVGFENGTSSPTDQDTLGTFIHARSFSWVYRKTGKNHPLTCKWKEEFLQDIAERHDWANYHQTADFVSEEGRSLPYLHLRAGEAYNDSGKKIRIWLEGAVHGNEPGGDQAILAVLGKLDANETWSQEVLEKTEILAIPRYNPDGVAYFQRWFATGYDPNRDHAVLQRQQTRDIKKLLSDFNPHIVLDAHEYNPTTFLGASKQWIKAQDAQFSAAKNPNTHKDIIDLSEGLFTNTVFATLESHGMRTGPYFTADEGTDDLLLVESNSAAEAAENSGALVQALAFLSETRGIGLGDQHFHRRVASGLIIAETIIQLAVDNFDLVYDTIEGARQEFINGVDEIIVLDKPRATNITMDFINSSDGSVVAVPAQFINNTYPEIILTRPRPEAYIFSRGWSDVAERLRVFGLEVEELSEEYFGVVEALTIETVELAESRHQGIVETTVTTSAHTREVKFPKGAYRVSTKQQNAAFAFVTLEPENLTSYVRYNVIAVEEGEEYPVFRIP